MKGKIGKLNFIKIKNCTLADAVKRMSIQATEQEKVFVNHTLDISKMYEEL